MIQQRREQQIKQSYDRNAFIQAVVGETAEKVNTTKRPVTFETHIKQWKVDLKQRRRQ